ncbi:MAG: class F sortase [Actinomycetota bacterium]|nr:class F sortase [Actinomycetota bacterium]
MLGRTLVGAAAATLVLAFAAGWWSWTEPLQQALPTRATTPASSKKPSPVVRPVVPASRAPSVIRPETPRAARLPSGTVVPIMAISANVHGVLDVPRNIRTAGWWRGGSRLGDPFGSTLLAAHVDSIHQGLGPYVELLRLRPGQHIVLTSTTLRQTFVVRSLQLVRQGTLAKHTSIYAATGIRRLTLVTCAPPYVRSRGGYQQLAIVTATPLADPVRRAS